MLTGAVSSGTTNCQGMCIPIRWEVAILIFTGLVANYSLRLNLSIAIVEITNSTSADGTVITWTSEEKNYVNSAFFYGYVVMQVHINSMLSSEVKAGKFSGH